MDTTGFWWVLLATLLYGVLHSVLASDQVKWAVEKHLGVNVSRRWYRLFFVLIVSLTLLPVLALLVLLPDDRLYAIPVPWVWLTIFLQLAALAALVVGVMQTGALSFIGIRQWADKDVIVHGPRPEKLIITGLYRWVRHPLYTATLLLIWLMPVMSWNLLAANLGFTIYILVGAYFFEEPKLVTQFGEAYVQYRRKTPMIIPGLKRRH